MNKPLIFGIGEIVWDCLPEGKKLGGAPVNFAYYTGKLGAESYPVSAVGTDSLGDEALDCCRSFGLDTRFIFRNALPTSRVLVSLDKDGIPQYEILQGVAWDSLEATKEVLTAVSRADAICWGSLAGRSEISFKAISALIAAAPKNCMKVFDINLRQHYYSKDKIESSLEAASVLKLNEDELAVLQRMFTLSSEAGSALREIALRWNLDYVVYTCGAAYSEIYTTEGLVSHINTPKVNVADTVGAGDSFTAAFITSTLLEKTLSEAHLEAVELAAKVCTMPGAIASI